MKLIVKFKSILLVMAGTLVLAFGASVFVIPFDLVAGGVTGFSVVLVRWIPDLPLSVDQMISIWTWLLFFVGLFFLGRNFAVKTLLSSLLYPVALSAFLRLLQTDTVGAFLDLRRSMHADIALLVAAILGGLLFGVGCALTFLGGGSTGGTDILALLVCKYVPKVKSSTAMFWIDAVIILVGAFVIGDFVLSLLGVVSAFICAWVIDRMLPGISKALVAQIVSDKCEEINDAVISRLERTSTLFSIRGGYSGTEKQMVSVTVSVRQYAELMQLVNRIDPQAFMTVYRAHAIRGEGWDEKT